MLHTSKDIRSPGLRTLPPGVERYFVRGGGLSIIEVLPEDKIEIIRILHAKMDLKNRMQD